jgi:hypothetical protein
MAARKVPSGRARKATTQQTDGPGEGTPPEEPPRLGRNPDADPVRIHREYVQRRLGGGALPTPEAYENALDEWHRLPGAVRGVAGEVHSQERPARGEREQAELDVVDAPGEGDTYEGPLPATEPGDNRPYEGGQR